MLRIMPLLAMLIYNYIHTVLTLHEQDPTTTTVVREGQVIRPPHRNGSPAIQGKSQRCQQDFAESKSVREFDQIPRRFRQTRHWLDCAGPGNIGMSMLFQRLPPTINSKVVTPYIAANLNNKIKNMKTATQSGKHTPQRDSRNVCGLTSDQCHLVLHWTQEPKIAPQNASSLQTRSC